MPEFDWDALEEIVPRRDAKPPAPATTVYEFASRRGVSRNSASSSLNRAVEEGKLKSGHFWCPERNKWITYYWQPETESASANDPASR